MDHRMSANVKRVLPVEHRVHRPLPSIFPVPDFDWDFYLGEPYAKRRGGEGTGGFPVEVALQPVADWTEDHRQLMTACFLTSAAWAPDEGSTLILRWPPEAHLDDPGDISEPAVYECAEHEGEVGPGCLNCQDPLADPLEVSPAEWRWVVRVETWIDNEKGSSSAIDTFEDVHVMTTTMDPRDVDYRRYP